MQRTKGWMLVLGLLAAGPLSEASAQTFWATKSTENLTRLPSQEVEVHGTTPANASCGCQENCCGPSPRDLWANYCEDRARCGDHQQACGNCGECSECQSSGGFAIPVWIHMPAVRLPKVSMPSLKPCIPDCTQALPKFGQTRLLPRMPWGNPFQRQHAIEFCDATMESHVDSDLQPVPEGSPSDNLLELNPAESPESAPAPIPEPPAPAGEDRSASRFNWLGK